MSTGHSSAPESRPAVELIDVTKRFGENEVVKRLSLDVEEGEFLTLLGPSGCGKTTTLRLISGFELADAGEIRIDGAQVNDVPPFRRSVNTVFQSYALFPHLSVFDNVAYGLAVKRMPTAEIRRRAMDMLERVGLAERARDMPRQLSGGQMQRVALARALVNEPRVLLLDEPLSALDAQLRRAMQMELKHMQERLGISFVYVTHDQEEALVMSDRIAVMSGGRIMQVGPPDALFQRPDNRFVAEFLGVANLLPGRVADRNGDLCRVAVAKGVDIVAPFRPDLTVGADVVLALRSERVRLLIDGGESVHVEGTRLAGRLRETVYAGTAVRFTIEVTPDLDLAVEAPTQDLPFDYRDAGPGQELLLLIPARAPVVLPA
jgi:spermidine/putrescine transport system ATP-binding protein